MVNSYFRRGICKCHTNQKASVMQLKKSTEHIFCLLSREKAKRNKNMKKTNNTIIGACGEHYVAAYLSGHNLIVAMPRAGIPGFDLIVSNEKGGHSIRVQVKTGTQATRKTKNEGNIYLWSTSYAAIERDDKYLWYAYVWLHDWPNGDNLPEVFFVPSNVVVEVMKACKKNNESWPYFWMKKDDAEKYKGYLGFQSLNNAFASVAL